MDLRDDIIQFFVYGLLTERLRRHLNKKQQEKENTMELDQQALSNPAIREVVKEVVREELAPEIEKLKQKNQYLQEGNQYLNE